MGGTLNLRRIIGDKKAKHIISNSIVNINTETAEKLNIIVRSAPPRDLVSEAFKFAAQNTLIKKVNLISNKANINNEEILNEINMFLKNRDCVVKADDASAPIAKALIDFIFKKTHIDQYLDGLQYEFEVFCYLQQTEDCREGITAMVNERKAVFKGR